MTEVAITQTQNPDGSIDIRLWVEGELKGSWTATTAEGLASKQGEAMGKSGRFLDLETLS